MSSFASQAFARAAGLELLQGLAEGFQGGGVERLRIGRVGHQYAGPGQHGERIERRRLADQGGYAFGGGDQLAGALLVDLQALAGGFLGEAQGAFHLATRQALAQRLAHRAFEVAEGVGQAQVGLQVTVVDRAQPCFRVPWVPACSTRAKAVMLCTMGLPR